MTRLRDVVLRFAIGIPFIGLVYGAFWLIDWATNSVMGGSAGDIHPFVEYSLAGLLAVWIVLLTIMVVVSVGMLTYAIGDAVLDRLTPEGEET